MSAFVGCREEKKIGGITYIFPCGHEYHMTAEAVHEYVTGTGPNVPEECPTCTQADGSK